MLDTSTSNIPFALREAMMQTFQITASEAILLGRCLELYLQRRADYETRHEVPSTGKAKESDKASEQETRDEERKRILFLRFLDTEFARFFPGDCDSFISTQCEPPLSVEWMELESFQWEERSGLEVGHSLDAPRALFYREDGIVSRVERRRQESTIVILIGEWLGSCVARSFFDHIRYVAPDEWARAEFDAVKKSNEFLSQQRWSLRLPSLRIGDDDSEAIIARLEDLVSAPSNDQSAHFECGRLFGRLESVCDCYLREVVGTLSDVILETDYCPVVPEVCRGLESASVSRSEWREQSQAVVRQLLENETFPRGGLGEVALQQPHPDDISPESKPGWDEDDELSIVEIVEIERFRATLMFALGEMVGRHWEQDTTRLRQDALSHDPRFTNLSPTCTHDRVRGQLDLVDSWFCQGNSRVVSPANVVSALSNSIEALTRRCWPDDFRSGAHRSSVSIVLHNYRKSGSELEQRFASIALSLHSQYRNPSQHNLDGFSATWCEALFFRHGIRVLLELSDSICNNE